MKISRILKKPLKPFILRQHHLDIASVLLKHRGERLSDVKIQEELYGGHDHHGWEIDAVLVMAGCFYLSKFGYLDKIPYGDYSSNEKTLSLFDLTPVPG